MSRYAFLRTRRWVGLAVLAVVVAVTCVLLGLWQWDRHSERAAANHLIDTNYSQPVAPLTEVAGDAVTADVAWRQVATSGRYVGEQQVVRNRPVGGVRAARVLAVLATDGDRLVVVDRGWLPLGEGELTPPDYPDGEVQLVGRVREAEPADSRVPPAGQVYRIAPEQVVQAALDGEAGPEPGTVLDGYLLAVDEEPAPATPLEAFPRPETSPGSHLSYAFQWWVFALGALVGYVILARREAAEVAPADPGRSSAPADPPAPGAARTATQETSRKGSQKASKKASRKQRRTDADEEDALIDAQLSDR